MKNYLGEIITETVKYKHNGTNFTGFAAHDSSIKGKRPGVLVAHEWWGVNDFIKAKVVTLASMGYTSMAVDLYGEGFHTTDPKIAAETAGKIRGTPLLRERILTGFAQLQDHPLVNSSETAAIGFCFGGSAVLELAFSGMKLKGAVTFHGGLIIPNEEEAGRMRAKLLILHGALDPNVKPETIAKFQGVLNKGGADYQMIIYSNAVHAFTNPAGGTDSSKGLAYNPTASRRSWRQMQLFFDELFEKD